MEARIYNYECKHSHVDGHRLLFAWPHGIEMLIDFTIGKGYILKRGDMKDQFDLQDVTIAGLEHKIAQCQDGDDEIAPLCGYTRERLTEICKGAINLEDLADYIMEDQGRQSLEFSIGVAGGELLLTGTYFYRSRYDRHDDPERINPPEYSLALFEFYLEDDFKIEFFRDGCDEEGLDLTKDIALDEEELKSIIHNKAKEA